MGIDFFDVELITYSAVMVVGALVLIIAIRLFSPLIGKKTRQHQLIGGIQFQDVERMHNEGLISEEEYRRLRKSVAYQESDRLKEKDFTKTEKEILARGAIDPKALHELIPPRKRDRKPPDSGKTEPDIPVDPPRKAERAGPENTTPAGIDRTGAHGRNLPPRTLPQVDNSVLVDPLGGVAGDAESEGIQAGDAGGHPSDMKPAQPSMNMPRVVREKNRAGDPGADDADTSGDKPAKPELDVEAMYERGAITDEEYMKLKQYFTDS
jgi:hypothetical protein